MTYIDSDGNTSQAQADKRNFLRRIAELEAQIATDAPFTRLGRMVEEMPLLVAIGRYTTRQWFVALGVGSQRDFVVDTWGSAEAALKAAAGVKK